MPQRHRTELDELDAPCWPASARFVFARDARLFTRPRTVVARLEARRRVLPLAPSQLLHPPVPVDGVVRLGQLRVSEFLPDGREVCRAVLQAGAWFRTQAWAEAGQAEAGQAEAGESATGPETADLADIVLMALAEAEVWLLPPGLLAELT